MIQEKFEELADLLGCEYEYTEDRYVTLISRNIPISHHSLRLVYKSVEIIVHYELGGHSLAYIKSVVKPNRKIARFEVNTRSQVQRLFSSNKCPFKVKSEDPLLKSDILQLLEVAGYNEIARKTIFEPTVSGSLDNGFYSIRTDFYLGFEGKEHAILPSINLHKQIIDLVVSQQ